MIGTTVGNFRVVERIGDGGMGAVYRAVDVMLDREVAIKVLRPELARNSALIERFRQEAIALARLNHPRIATLHGLERHGESLLMIMEYVRGDTFEALVARSGRIAWPRAAELCAATLEALDHAHDKGVVHRDIKPANVMLAAGGGVKVMDFGIARLMGKSRQTQVGHSVGTPMYMAPEQLRGEEVDGRTDLYAVGAVLFELITGRMAFESDSDFGLMMKQLEEPPPPTRTFVPGVPPVVDALIARAMAKRREDRFPSAAAFREALLGAVAEHAAPSRAAAVPAPTRFAAPEPEPETAMVPPALRLVDDTRETRLAGPSVPHAPETRLAGAPPVLPAPTRVASAPIARWQDWRVYAAAGGLFAAAGFAVTLARGTATSRDTRVADSIAAIAAADSSRTMADAGVVRGGGGLAPGGENAQSLIINRPAPPAASAPPPATAPDDPPGAPPAGAPRGGRASGAGGAGGSRDAEASDANRATPRPAEREAPSAAKGGASAPPASTAESSVEDSEAEQGRRIRVALENAASLLSGKDPVAASLLDGGVRDQWADLMREGRVSLTVSGAPDVQRGGGRATAEFGGIVNVRSPFGANRKRNARFAAELERRGGGWHVTRLRVLGGLSLQ